METPRKFLSVQNKLHLAGAKCADGGAICGNEGPVWRSLEFDFGRQHNADFGTGVDKEGYL